MKVTMNKMTFKTNQKLLGNCYFSPINHLYISIILPEGQNYNI